MHIILFDDKRWQQLLPLTFTRPVAELRIGIDLIREKWEASLNGDYSWLCEPYLAGKYPVQYGNDNLYIYGGTIPDATLLNAISQLKTNEVLMASNEVIAVRSSEHYFSGMSLCEHAAALTPVLYNNPIISITRPWHLFQYNDEVLRADFDRKTAGRKSQDISGSNTIIGNQIFVEPGAKVEAAIINTNAGPVYIGNDAEIMEGSMIRGPFALGKHSTIKMGAKIYGATTIGPHCKVGGEVNNSVFQSYSNKAHDGFIGNSVIGEWCNIGADSNNSNLKNNYAEVKLWDYQTQKFIPTGLQFCGLIMGDHSKCGINTMFNTGTVVGVNANIFGDGFPRNFIPSYSWGGAAGFVTYKLSDAMLVAVEVLKRRSLTLSEADKKIMTTIYELSEKYRKGQLIFLHK
jgi:UDP-N-acetylglucosamine diphosphorylase/glucosamine-1-phosphate N-acetyltransferase